MNGRIPPRGVAVAVCLLGVIIAIYVGMDRYIDFLYMIASIFAPMVAVLLVDWFVLGRRSSSRVGGIFNVFAWFLGLIVYHLSLRSDFILGSALPSMVAAGIIAFAKGLLPSRFYGLKEVK
jgi:purine-cytosine permease-like protein